MPALLPLTLTPSSYPGGVGIWGALPAIYDTTNRPIERGVHVHAREIANGRKVLDGSYSQVHVSAATSSVIIDEASAGPYVAAAVLNLPIEDLRCPHCNAPHLDTGRFALRPHQRHICEHCKFEFLVRERSIGNPIILAKRELGDLALVRPTVPGSPRPQPINQSHPGLSGGVLVWASNPAILWTPERSEEEGIHVHAFKAGIPEPVIDNTYQRVEIDGINIDATMARVFMVQQSFPHLRDTVTSLTCSKCGAEHFDDVAPFAVEPHRNHPCTACDFCTISATPIISNPIVDVLKRCYASAAASGIRKNPLAP